MMHGHNADTGDDDDVDRRIAEALDWPESRQRDVIDVRKGNKPRRQGWIYFIGADSGPIKIGFTCDVQERLKRLSLSSPRRLRVLAKVAGAIADERIYHARFKRQRLHSEWFERAPEILAEIERLSSSPTPSPKSCGVGR